MNKITISDFVIALIDLLEAESRALQENASRFMREQQATLKTTLYQGGWMVAWIAAAVVALLGGLGFLSWALYRFLATLVPETGAIVIVGVVFLLIAFLFSRLAMRKRP